MLALVGGVGFAIFLVQSRWIELAFYPLAVILQVTPIVAISPLILIYAPSTQVALLICAFLVAFFPILSNMVQGLKSVDHNLLNLFDLYGAGRWKSLIYLKIPASMPYFLTGLRIGGGLRRLRGRRAFGLGLFGLGTSAQGQHAQHGNQGSRHRGGVHWKSAAILRRPGRMQTRQAAWIRSAGGWMDTSPW